MPENRDEELERLLGEARNELDAPAPIPENLTDDEEDEQDQNMSPNNNTPPRENPAEREDNKPNPNNATEDKPKTTTDGFESFLSKEAGGDTIYRPAKDDAVLGALKNLFTKDKKTQPNPEEGTENENSPTPLAPQPSLSRDVDDPLAILDATGEDSITSETNSEQGIPNDIVPDDIASTLEDFAAGADADNILDLT